MEIVNVCRAVLQPNKKCFKKSENVGKYVEKILSESRKIVEENAEFSADEFVENLLTEGSKIACDDTSAIFNNSLHVPYFYNEEMFKNGQRFFRRNMFGLFLSKFMGLVILLTVPTSLKILIMTNMSSTNLTAYRRYVATIFHMCLWYDEYFKPGSRSWESLLKVRSMHNSASKKNYSRMNFRISQMDMALTQFGFMGFGLVRKRMMGIHDVTDTELKGFVHLWRTVGYILGIEDRFTHILNNQTSYIYYVEDGWS